MATAAAQATGIPQDAMDVIYATNRQRAARQAISDATTEMRARLEVGIPLGGVTWVPLRRVTFELQNRRVDVVQRSGVMALFPSFNIAEGDPTELAAAVLQTAFASGVLFEMLAHLLVEADVEYLPWSATKAAERARFFASLVEPADHTLLADEVLWLVLDFFLSASASSPIFLKSLARGDSASARTDTRSTRSTDHTGPANDHLQNTPSTADDLSFEATSTSDDGTPSFEPSPASEPSTLSPSIAP